MDGGEPRRGPELPGPALGRYQVLVGNKDVLDDRNKRAFLMTPREEFVLRQNLGRAYDHAFLDIGYRRDHLRPARRRPHDHRRST